MVRRLSGNEGNGDLRHDTIGSELELAWRAAAGTGPVGPDKSENFYGPVQKKLNPLPIELLHNLLHKQAVPAISGIVNVV